MGHGTQDMPPWLSRLTQLVGGAGAYIADALDHLDERRSAPSVVVLGTPAEYIPHGKADVILANLGLDGPGIAAAAAKTLAARAISLD